MSLGGAALVRPLRFSARVGERLTIEGAPPGRRLGRMRVVGVTAARLHLAFDERTEV